MRKAGTEKMKRADLEDSSRTKTKKVTKKPEVVAEEAPITDAPMEPIDDDMTLQDLANGSVLEPVNDEPDAMRDL